MLIDLRLFLIDHKLATSLLADHRKVKSYRAGRIRIVLHWAVRIQVTSYCVDNTGVAIHLAVHINAVNLEGVLNFLQPNLMAVQLQALKRDIPKLHLNYIP